MPRAIPLIHFDNHDLVVGSRLDEILEFLEHLNHTVPIIFAMILLPLQIIDILSVVVVLLLEYLVLQLNSLKLILLSHDRKRQLMRLHLVLDLRILGLFDDQLQVLLFIHAVLEHVLLILILALSHHRLHIPSILLNQLEIVRKLDLLFP